MKRVVQVGGVLTVLLSIAMVAVPSHVEITVTPVGSDRGAVSGWVESAEDARVALHDQRTPWARRVAGRGMAGRFEADGENAIQVRAELFKGPLRLSELRLVGGRVSLTNRNGSFSGRTR